MVVMHVVGVSVYTPTLYRTGWVSLIPACALMQHIAMWCTGVCCLVVATTMLLECTSKEYISFHTPASDQKGESSSSLPPAKRSRQVSLSSTCMVCINTDLHYVMCWCALCHTNLLFCFSSEFVTAPTEQVLYTDMHDICSKSCVSTCTLYVIVCMYRELYVY